MKRLHRRAVFVVAAAALFILHKERASLYAESPTAAPTSPTANSNEERQRAIGVLESAARAYASLPALRDKLSYIVAAPGANPEEKAEEYGFDPNGAAFVKNALQQAIAIQGKMYLVQSDIADKYVVASDIRDFGATLKEINSQGSLFEPAPLAMHFGKAVTDCINGLRFNLLGPLQIAGCRHIVGKTGQPADEIRFSADNGELSLQVDSATHFFEAISFRVRPQGAPTDFSVQINGEFSPRTKISPEETISFEPGSRRAVSSITALQSSNQSVGNRAPDFHLKTLQGEVIKLADLRGSVMVLDFWATWCAPCWSALRETQALSDSMNAAHLPAKVIAVDTLERGTNAEENLERARKFWRSQGLTMPSLIDFDGEMFKAYGNPGLPGIVIISPTGTIVQRHEGLLPDMQHALRREVESILASEKRDATESK